MIKLVKIIGLLIIAGFVGHYVYVTSNFALKHTRWLYAGGDSDCDDAYFVSDKDLPKRNRTWSVQYRYVDVILWTYDDQGNVKCRYASKGIYF